MLVNILFTQFLLSYLVVLINLSELCRFSAVELARGNRTRKTREWR